MKSKRSRTVLIIGLICVCLIGVFTCLLIKAYKERNREELSEIAQMNPSVYEETDTQSESTTEEEIEETQEETPEEIEDTEESVEVISDIQAYIDDNDEKKVHDVITGEDQSVERIYCEEDDSYEESAVVNRSAQLGVDYLAQNPELPTGCEITSLTTVLHYYGYSISKVDMARAYLPKCNFGEGSFWDYFLGDPENDYSYGCYASPIVTAANSFFYDHGQMHVAYNYSNSDFSVLLNQVAEGRPVVLWSTIGLQRAYMTTQWVLNGRVEQWTAPEHCVVLTGYDLDAQTVTISDPLKGIMTYDLRTVVNRYNQMHRQAVVVIPVETESEEEPTDPVEPTEPEATTDPVDPTEPEVTTDPVEPTEPEVTTDPVEPTEPEVVTDPVESTNPTETEQPVETTTPAEVTMPAETT